MTIWNATIVTAVSEFWDTAEDMAHTKAWEMLTPEEQSAQVEMKFEPIWSKGERMYRLLEKPEIVHEKFGGLTCRDYQKNSPKRLYKTNRRKSLNRSPQTAATDTASG